MPRTADQSETGAPTPSPHDADLAFATRAIHHGYDPAGFSNAVQPPVPAKPSARGRKVKID